ncbi:MAG TPA: porin [Candidatus Acidoferrales bacterium]|nr:porin [Candidatus Acidoferrales bacterium]
MRLKNQITAGLLLMFIGYNSRSFAADGPKPTPAKTPALWSTDANTVSQGAASSCTATAADSEVDKLLLILVEKHVLSADEAASVRVELKSADEKPAKERAALRRTPVILPSDSGHRDDSRSETYPKLPFTISGYGQIQWNSLPGAGSTFQLRRGRISLDGDIHKIANYTIQVEALNMPALLDAYLQLKPASFANLTFGQFKIPFSQENVISSSDLLTIERSQVVNSLAPGRDIGSNGRDIGADFSGSYSASHSSSMDYAFGVFNGAGIGRKDNNNRKDFAARLAIRSFQGLSLAGDYYSGAAGTAELVRDRQDAEIAYTYRPLLLRGEFIWGRDGAIHEQGWYGLAAWHFSKVWEGVFRADAFNPDRSKTGNITSTYIAGFNWYFATHLKWQLNEGTQSRQSRLRNVFLSQLQFKF